ncbi:MAG: hypothetical protein JXA72_12980 [Bacteroidales bacterium]|nr:hypothetical protein [Bacteroidales bacterium]
MRTATIVLLVILVTLTGSSCKQVKEYFRDPDTENLTETIQTAVTTGYAASIAIASASGRSFPNVTTIRSNPGYPCTTLTQVDLQGDPEIPTANEKASGITIAALWADETCGILTLLFTDYQSETSTFDLLAIKTIPVIRDDEGLLRIALASQDICMNPDQESILQINLSTLEIESEYMRLDHPGPDDVYIAIEQDAYLITVDGHETPGDALDDDYTITGGGQLIALDNQDAEIIQQGLLDIRIAPSCHQNPVAGMALIRAVGIKNSKLPELGTALLEFSNKCTGTAWVMLAIGMYAGANSKAISIQP